MVKLILLKDDNCFLINKGAFMDEEMKIKIDSILDRVKDPESGLSVSALGLIKKLRYSDKEKHLYVFTDFVRRQPGCLTCAAVASLVCSSIQKELETELKKEFSDLEIEFV